MAWTNEQQARFDDLRQRELSAPLPEDEQRELAVLRAALEAEERQL